MQGIMIYITKYQKYATFVGDGGTYLSGGEKQRIALARALVRKPTILILDEATSALDYRNEAIVQRAIDHASENRTTIVITHNLSSLKKADMIFFLDNGKCVESGNYGSLMAQDGRFAKMANLQANFSDWSDEDEDEDEDKKTEDANSTSIYCFVSITFMTSPD